MRALILPAHGAPEVLTLTEVPDPPAMTGNVRVRVRACGINHLDVHIRRGLDKVSVTLPHILGSDVAGDVDEDLPDGRWQQGDRVVVAPGVSCWECARCLAGDDHLCDAFGVIGGYRLPGGYAEIVSVPTRNLVHLPPHIPYAVAAAIPTAYLTAWQMLARVAGVVAGDVVLVRPGSGGVGLAAVQIAHVLGAQVLATTSSPEKEPVITAAGASHVIPTHTCSRAVEDLLGRRSVDVVIDHGAGADLHSALRLLRNGGVYVTCGAATIPDQSFDTRRLFSRNLSIHGSSLGRRADLDRLVDLVATDRLHPVVDRVLPLAQVAEAHRLIESRAVVGKLVASVADGGR